MNNWIRIVAGNINLHPDLPHLIRASLKNIHQPQMRIYCFGQQNYQMIIDLGFEAQNHQVVLLDEKELTTSHIFETKLHAINYAMNVDKIQEIIYHDWDCIPLVNIDDFFAKTLDRNNFFLKANLTHFKCNNHAWKEENKRVVINAGFMHIKDPSYPKLAYDSFKQIDYVKHWNDEIAWTYALDIMNGSPVSIDEYWEKYEPFVVRISKKSMFHNRFTPEFIKQYPTYLMHYTTSMLHKKRVTRRLLGKQKFYELETELKKLKNI